MSDINRYLNQVERASGKRWYKSKTLWLAVAQSLGGILLILDGEGVGWALQAKSALDVVLRYLTKGPVR